MFDIVLCRFRDAVKRTRYATTRLKAFYRVQSGERVFMRAAFGLGVLVTLVSLQIMFVAPAFGATTHDVRLAANDSPGIDDLSFSPPSIVITKGDTVRWVTSSSVPHTVSSATGLFESTPQFNDTLLQQIGPILFGPGGFLLPGASFNTTFSTPGDYAYYCKIHPYMQGIVTVTNVLAAPQEVVYASAGWGSQSLSFTSYSPKHLTVKSGATVVWTNEEVYEPHTVTSATGDFDSSPNLTPQVLAGFESLPFMIRGGKESFSYTFTQAGTYGYFCRLHQGMRGWVSVLAPADFSQVNSDISKVNSDLSTVNSRLDLSTILAGVAVVLGVIGTSISAAVWRRLPKKTPA